MEASYRYIRFRLAEAGLLPRSRVARIAWYLLGLDVLLFVLEKVLGLLKPGYGTSLGGWVAFLTLVSSILFFVLAYRWLKVKMLWRLRNRLIVTYVFIGVTPVVLLVVLALGTFYLFAGQFATYIVTTGLNSQLRGLEAANTAIAHDIAARLEANGAANSSALEGLQVMDKNWADREVYAWLKGKLVMASSPRGVVSTPPILPPHVRDGFTHVVRDSNQLFLRSVTNLPLGSGTLTVLSSEPFDEHMLRDLANNLGEVTLYAAGLTFSKVQPGSAPPQAKQQAGQSDKGGRVTVRRSEGDYVLETGGGTLVPTYTVGEIPPQVNLLDRKDVSFATTVTVANWETGDTSQPVAISVQTRFSKLYERLFESLGGFAPAIEFGLLIVAVLFAVIELVALIIGTRLTRTITKAIAQLYVATTHINRGDFRHRIPVRSSDQLATLANSFNSMTTSLEQLIEEQKQKQRLENELAIAQEVQAQLFPKQATQLESLEVHGFCRPARTVSGDYYDFLCIDPDKLLLAVGDISGKGISAALLMATIHSAVRAYSMEGIPMLREEVPVGAGAGSALLAGVPGAEASASTLLALLNHQLYASTPSEKYATLFLGIFDGSKRTMAYSNGGHLPPIIMTQDGSVQRLDCGGTVVGLFDNMSYEEGSIPLRRGDLFVAFSDGVTEPENDFGEFGEDRLIELLQENRELPLERISEIITAAVDDWIGGREQPDDVTLVLARVR